MKEIRIHGRCGKGSVTAAELLGIAAFEDGMHKSGIPVIWRGVDGGARDGVRPPVRPKNQTTQPCLCGMSFNLPSMGQGELHDRCVCSFPNVSKNILKNIIIHLSSITEQQAIVQKLDILSAETKKTRKNLHSKLTDLEELKKSILAKAFNGELTEASA